MRLELLTSAADFLAAAAGHLARDPVLSTVVATVADRTAAEGAAGLAAPAEDWWLVVRDDGGEVVGIGMRTAPFVPRPAYLLPMPDEAAVALARLLHERGEPLAAVNGALPAVRRCAEETARLTGTTARVHIHTRLFRLDQPVPARPVPGRLRAAGASDLPLVRAWFDDFHRAADRQAGREAGGHAEPTLDDDALLRRVESDLVWLWEDDAGRVVHLTARNAVSFGAARIGPVYTPEAERGRGWASAAVAEVAASILAEGGRPCLFTDQANPVSNRIYEALGFRPVVDMADYVLA